MVSTIPYNIWTNKRYAKLSDQYQGFAPPESRLPLCMAGAIAAPISLFWVRPYSVKRRCLSGSDYIKVCMDKFAIDPLDCVNHCRCTFRLCSCCHISRHQQLLRYDESKDDTCGVQDRSNFFAFYNSRFIHRLRRLCSCRHCNITIRLCRRLSSVHW